MFLVFFARTMSSHMNLTLLIFWYRFMFLGMHRHVEHRVDFMEWAPGLDSMLLLFLL